jgi:hypothetical protein
MLPQWVHQRRCCATRLLMYLDEDAMPSGPMLYRYMKCISLAPYIAPCPRCEGRKRVSKPWRRRDRDGGGGQSSPAVLTTAHHRRLESVAFVTRCLMSAFQRLLVLLLITFTTASRTGSFGHHDHAHTRLFRGTLITPSTTPNGACRKSDAVSETTT